MIQIHGTLAEPGLFLVVLLIRYGWTQISILHFIFKGKLAQL